MSQEQPNHTGHILAGRYEIIDEIGRGGFGMVYRARQLNMNREVAVKVLPPQFMAIEDIVERFKREAQLTSRLSHPNTITIHDYGQAENLLFIVMELLNGEDLADLLKREHKLPEERLLHIARQVLKSLAEAHEHGIVHRDLKPENIFLNDVRGEQDYVKVLDFGIAKLAEPDGNSLNGRKLTVTGSTVGTPVYMSPEQAAGEEVDHLTDLYAMGVIIYEMACGQPPFSDDNPVKVMRSHLFNEVPPFPEDSGLAGSPLERVVMRALSKDKELRFQDAGEFLRALDNPEPQIAGLPMDLMAPPPSAPTQPSRPGHFPPEPQPQAPLPDEELPTIELADRRSEDSFDDIALGDTAAFDKISRSRETGEHEVSPITGPEHASPRDAIPFAILPERPERVREGAISSSEISNLSRLADHASQPLDYSASEATLEPPPDLYQRGLTSASSILTVVEAPPTDEEVFVLTQPKNAESPQIDLGRGGEAPIPLRPPTIEPEQPHSGPIEAPNTGEHLALEAGAVPTTESGEDWHWDPSQSAELTRDVESGAFPQLKKKQQRQGQGDGGRKLPAPILALLVLTLLALGAGAVLLGLGYL